MDGAAVWVIVKDVQPLSRALIVALAPYRKDGPRASTRPSGLNGGSTFVVRGVKTCDANSRDNGEIWTIEDVVSRQVSTVHIPTTISEAAWWVDPDTLLNTGTGVIPILEWQARVPWHSVFFNCFATPVTGVKRFTFSLASLDDDRKTALYAWYTNPMPLLTVRGLAPVEVDPLYRSREDV